MTNAEKAKLAVKLNAMRAKANDPSIKGTPEAINAMHKFNELMQKHNLNLSDLDIKTSKLHAEARKTEQNTTCIGHLAVMIAQFTDTRVKAVSNTFIYAGFPSDVQHATFMFEVVETAFRNGKKAYIASPEYTRLIDAMLKPFLILQQFEMGMTSVIHFAIEEMIADKKKNNPGTNLIVLKNALITQELGEENNGEASTDIVPKADNRALHSGMREGKKVRLKKEAESVVKGYLK